MADAARAVVEEIARIPVGLGATTSDSGLLNVSAHAITKAQGITGGIQGTLSSLSSVLVSSLHAIALQISQMSVLLPIDDTISLVKDPSDPTKQMRIDAGNIATGTVRVLTMPDADVELFKNNLIATVAPTATDDSSLGYAIGSVCVPYRVLKLYGTAVLFRG